MVWSAVSDGASFLTKCFTLIVFLLLFCQGEPPEPWEEAIGDTGERVGRQGRAVVEYAAKMNAMGIVEKSLAGENNPIADHVATIGQDKMRLLPGVPVEHNHLAGDNAGSWLELPKSRLETTCTVPLGRH